VPALLVVVEAVKAQGPCRASHDQSSLSSPHLLKESPVRLMSFTSSCRQTAAAAGMGQLSRQTTSHESVLNPQVCYCNGSYFMQSKRQPQQQQHGGPGQLIAHRQHDLQPCLLMDITICTTAEGGGCRCRATTASIQPPSSHGPSRTYTRHLLLLTGH